MVSPYLISDKGGRISWMLRTAAANNLSGRALQRQLIANGLGYNRKVMMDDYRMFNIMEKNMLAKQRIPVHQAVPKDYYFKPKSTIVEERYASRLEIRYYNKNTGEVFTSHETIGHDALKSTQELADSMFDRLNDQRSKRYLVFLDAKTGDTWQGRAFV